MWRYDTMTGKQGQARDRHTMMQKEIFAVSDHLRGYLKKFGRATSLPILYTDLLNYSFADSVKDKKGKWTHWERATYEAPHFAQLSRPLVATYCLLKNAPAEAGAITIQGIEFCEFGNSIPFRVKLFNENTGESDFFYIKQADASRVYGLELESLLTHNTINFLYDRNSLVEEHISGIAGDLFLQHSPPLDDIDSIALSKAFVRFNESCFLRLLGDMRSYNFVVNTGMEEGKKTFRFRPIDFDQQSYEGHKDFYLPASFPENLPYVELVGQTLSPETVDESREAEFISAAVKTRCHRRQLAELLDCMVNDELSVTYKIKRLKKELNEHFTTSGYTFCHTMGEVVKQQLRQILQEYLRKPVRTHSDG